MNIPWVACLTMLHETKYAMLQKLQKLPFLEQQNIFFFQC